MLRNIFKVLSSQIIVKSIGLLNIAIVLLFLSVKDFGNYSYALLLLNLVAIVIDPFLSSYLVDYRSFNFKKFNFGILFLSIVLFPIFYFLVKTTNKDLGVLLFLSFAFTFLISTSLKSYLNVNERYYSYGLIDILRQLTIFITTLIFYFFFPKNNYVTLLEFNYATSLIVLVFVSFLVTKKNEIEFDINFKKLKHQTTNSKFLIFYTALIPIIFFVDSFFVDKYLSEETLGLYSFSLKIYNVSLMMVVPIFTVLNIKQIDIAKKNNYKEFVKSNFKKIIFFSFLFFVAVIFFNWLLTHIFYTSYKPSFWITNILIVGSFFTYISIPFSFLIAYRKYKHLFLLAVFAMLCNILINYFFIEENGVYAAALSTLVSQIIINFGAATISYYLLK